jgi:hypothetical protein
MKTNIPSRLYDDELTAELKRLAGCERGVTVDLIIHLAEFDRRRLYLPAGFSSLFAYCIEVLRLSEHAAYHRIVAARTARRFPVVLRMLAQGSLNLTSVRLLAPHLSAGNHEELFTAASGKSKRELQELRARRFPQPDVAVSIRKLPAPRATAEPPRALTLTGAAVARATLTAAAVESPVSAPPSPGVPVLSTLVPIPPLSGHRPVVTPLAPDRYQITFTASAKTREKLQLAQDLLRHTIPSGDTAAIIDRALTALLEDLARDKFAATTQPRVSRGTAKGSRSIPASVMRAVWIRDLGRCVFVSKDGRRCDERGFIEFHHVVPHGVGGPPTESNLELRCKSHNAYEADLYYGPRAPEGVICESPAPYRTSARRGNSVRTELSRRRSTLGQGAGHLTWLPRLARLGATHAESSRLERRILGGRQSLRRRGRRDAPASHLGSWGKRR